jgi:hypothetical protein
MPEKKTLRSSVSPEDVIRGALELKQAVVESFMSRIKGLRIKLKSGSRTIIDGRVFEKASEWAEFKDQVYHARTNEVALALRADPNFGRLFWTVPDFLELLKREEKQGKKQEQLHKMLLKRELDGRHEPELAPVQKFADAIPDDGGA